MLSALVVLFALVGSAEIFSFLYLRHVLALPWRPAYLGPPLDENRVGAWRVPHPLWGNWRLANVTARQESGCFSVALRSNGIGARDRERAREGVGRTVVLGDSYAEGWGVEEDMRLSNVLEQRLGREFLNFGAATHGPLQYQLVYEDMASAYAHDHVLIMLLADNDFTDNDFAFWQHKTNAGGRARPYYERVVGEGYRAIYPVPQRVETAPPRVPGVLEQFGRGIRRNSWALRTGEYLGELLSGRLEYAGYFDVSAAQLDAVVWTLGEIRRRAGDRKITIALIPRLNDFSRTARQGAAPLPAQLTERARAYDITVIDLLPGLRAATQNLASLFLPCDGHWNAAGNAAAASVLIQSGFGR